MQLPKFKSRVFLAPMAGITDPAFRMMCLKEGAGLVFTELTSIHGIIAKKKMSEEELLRFISHSKKEKPSAIQLFGNDIEKTKAAAQIVEPYFDIIDFNIGCPAPHITSQEAGAALLQKPEHMEKLLSALISAVNKPVSIKMRSGAGKNRHLFLKIAKIAEDAGVSMITLHPRTVDDGYRGHSDWSLIGELKKTVNCPVCGNGDIKTPEDAKKMLEETNCDFMMIGRAASGNPSIFRQTNEFLRTGKYDAINPDEKKEEFIKYLKLWKQYNLKFSDAKAQAMYFSKGISGGVEMRQKISRCNSINELEEIFSLS